MEYSHRSNRPRALRMMAALIVIASSLLLLARPPAARAEDYVVTTTADSGEGSLRAAIIAANASPGHDTITFDIPGSQTECLSDNVCTIRLTTVPLSPTGELTIDGTGANILISGNNERRIMLLDTSAVINLKRLTLGEGYAPDDGNGGGAILNLGGHLTVTGGLFVQNKSERSGGAIQNASLMDFSGLEPEVISLATLNVFDTYFYTNETINQHGGAIYNVDAMLNVDDSMFFSSKAEAGAGGAILTLSNQEFSTFVGATVVTDSGFYGNRSGPPGGAILNNSDLTVINSTFYENQVVNGNGGSLASGGPMSRMTVINSTIYNSDDRPGNAIFRGGGEVTLTNSLVVGDATYDNCLGNIIDGEGNLSNDASCDGTATPGLALEPLADNGGPTMTHALPSGSPAINYAGINADACPTTDQRGIDRPQGGGCDVGAFEAVVCSGPTYAVTNDAELTEAIRCINAATTGEQRIDIENAFTVYTLNNNYLGTPRLTYSADKVIIDGHDFILTGDGNGRFFRLSSGTVEISDITLTGGSAEFGGAIYAVSTDLTVTNSTFSDNSGNDYGGGAIYQELGELIVIDSTFTGNKAYDDGGAIGTDETEVTVTGSTFAKNSGDDGGAISFRWGTGEVTNSTFSENDAFYAGGAIQVDPGEVVVTNSTFYSNTAGTSGNGSILYAAGGDLTVRNSLMVSQSDGIACELSGFGEIHDGGGNLSDNAFCHGATTQPLMVMPLADNGGPTQTHALLEGSPAIDHVASGNPAPATDQRGIERPQGPRVDAGAFELEQEPVTDPCPAVDGNVITNFCFEDGSAPWTFHSDGHGVYNVSPFEPFAGNGAAEVKVTVPGSNVQFYQSGIELQGDTEYELTFAAKSKDGRDLSVFVHKHGANYASYGLSNHVFNLTDLWAEYTVTFKTPVFSGGSVNDARLRFWLAPFDAAGAVYSIDRVVLRPAGGDPLPEPPPPPDPEVPPQGECDPTPGNLIANPGYEDGTFGWSFFTNGSANFTAPETAGGAYECTHNARVKINTSGTNVQLFQTGIGLQPNTHYRLRLAAKATGANAVQLFVQRHSAPHSNYGLNGLKLDLTGDWQVFVVDFTTSGFASTTTDTRLRFWLAPYDTAGAVFEFDDVVLTPVVASPFRATDGAATRARATTADAHFISGYFIDNNHTDRLGGGYVGVLDGCRNARASVSRLWPANNKLWPVSIGNIGTPQSVAITGVWQDEPVGFEPDAVIGSGGALHLRAERDLDAGADGRVYTIQFRATYADGQSCNGIVTVGVPLSNRRGVEARSGGELFTSTDK